MFGTACLVTFGVGGTLISREAAAALDDEITRRLHVESQGYAAALDGHLGTLVRRAEDFASDGFVRDHVEAIADGVAVAGAVSDRAGLEFLRDELREHLLVNKLPLEAAFLDLTVLSVTDEVVLAARNEPAAEHLGRVARLEGDGPRFTDLLAPNGPEGPPRLAVSVPLTSRRDAHPLGRLVAWIHPGVWIVEALRGSAFAPSEPLDSTSPSNLRLIDHGGTRLVVHRDLVGASGPSAASDLVRSGFGLSLATGPDAAPSRESRTQRFPLSTSGWSLEVESTSDEAFDSVAGLLSRFFGLGVVLAALAAAIFVLPMRFLTRPLLQLTRAARRLELGDLSTRVEIETDDEFGGLGRSFNAMAWAVEEQARLQGRTAQDLRARQRELSSERDRLRAVISSMRDGLIVLDADGEPVVHNAAAAPLLRQLRGAGRAMLPHHLCEHAGTANDACRACLFEPLRAPRSCQLELDGGVYEVHATRLPSDEDGRAGRVLIAFDLSDRIEHDERQIHQERLAVLGEVAAVMAHELNNPLAAISMYNQMLAGDLEEGSDLIENTTVIQRNVETCKRAVRELLDYATDTTPEVGDVDVRATLEDVAVFVRPLCERARIRLELPGGSTPLFTSGDEVQIRQLFVNLVVNAIQAVGDRGGVVRLETSFDERQVVVRVIDDGPGVPPEVRDQIFRPFFTTKKRGSGTGLGLPTSRRICEMHGGGIELAESGPEGTVFQVRLPRTALPRAAEASA